MWHITSQKYSILILIMIIAITFFFYLNIYFSRNCSGLANNKLSRAEEEVAPSENFLRNSIDPNIDPNTNDNSNVTVVFKGEDGFIKMVCFVELINLVPDYI